MTRDKQRCATHRGGKGRIFFKFFATVALPVLWAKLRGLNRQMRSELSNAIENALTLSSQKSTSKKKNIFGQQKARSEARNEVTK